MQRDEIDYTNIMQSIKLKAHDCNPIIILQEHLTVEIVKDEHTEITEANDINKRNWHPAPCLSHLNAS
jgi:hypothetical protein